MRMLLWLDPTPNASDPRSRAGTGPVPRFAPVLRFGSCATVSGFGSSSGSGSSTRPAFAIFTRGPGGETQAWSPDVLRTAGAESRPPICCGDRRAVLTENIEAVIELGKAAGGVNDTLATHMRDAIPQLFENRPSFESLEAWTNRHTMLAVAHLTIAAKSFGVDSCPMEGFVAAKVKEAFKIPEEVDVCCLLPLGYAAEPLKKYGGRFDLAQVYYSESYGESCQF